VLSDTASEQDRMPTHELFVIELFQDTIHLRKHSDVVIDQGLHVVLTRMKKTW